MCCARLRRGINNCTRTVWKVFDAKRVVEAVVNDYRGHLDLFFHTTQKKNVKLHTNVRCSRFTYIEHGGYHRRAFDACSHQKHLIFPRLFRRKLFGTRSMLHFARLSLLESTRLCATFMSRCNIKSYSKVSIIDGSNIFFLDKKTNDWVEWEEKHARFAPSHPITFL